MSSSGCGLRKSSGSLSANGWGSVSTQLVFGLRCPSTSGQRSTVQFAAQMLQGCSPRESLREQVRCSPGLNFPHLATACPAGCDLAPWQRWNGGPRVPPWNPPGPPLPFRFLEGPRFVAPACTEHYPVVALAQPLGHILVPCTWPDTWGWRGPQAS